MSSDDSPHFEYSVVIRPRSLEKLCGPSIDLGPQETTLCDNLIWFDFFIFLNMVTNWISQANNFLPLRYGSRERGPLLFVNGDIIAYGDRRVSG